MNVQQCSSWKSPCSSFWTFGRVIETQLRLSDRQSSVIERVWLIIASKVSNALHNDFGIVATSEGAFGVGPILLGLTLMIVRHVPWPFLVVA